MLVSLHIDCTWLGMIQCRTHSWNCERCHAQNFTICHLKCPQVAPSMASNLNRRCLSEADAVSSFASHSGCEERSWPPRTYDQHSTTKAFYSQPLLFRKICPEHLGTLSLCHWTYCHEAPRLSISPPLDLKNWFTPNSSAQLHLNKNWTMGVGWCGSKMISLGKDMQ